MSNRLGLAHTASRREPREWMPAPAPSHGMAATALRWLRGAIASDTTDLPAAMQRDLGLPETGPDAVVFGYEIERSRVRV